MSSYPADESWVSGDQDLDDPIDTAILRFRGEGREPCSDEGALTVLCEPGGAHRVRVNTDTCEAESCSACMHSQTDQRPDPRNWRCSCGRKGYDDVMAMQFDWVNPDCDISGNFFQPEPDTPFAFASDQCGFPTEEHGPLGCRINGQSVPAIVPEFVSLPDELAAAITLQVRLREARIAEVAQRRIAERTAVTDQRLDTIKVATGLEFLSQSDQPVLPLLGELVAEGHNATLTAAYKVGKTTMLAHASAALLTAGSFLGRFQIDRPRRVAWLNYEMTCGDQRALLRALNLPPDALTRLLVLGLRGSRLCLTTPAGRDRLVARLIEHRAEVLIIDTYGAAVAPSVESENDNAGVRRFLSAIDEIKELADCPSSLMSCHTGRNTNADGLDRARGATVLDDWADVRLLLTRDHQTEIRFLSSEGRSSYDLPESALQCHPATGGLLLPDGSVGTNRAAARANKAVEDVVRIVAKQAGLMTVQLRQALPGTNNGAKGAAIAQAKKRGLIHDHRDGRSMRHYLGKSHPPTNACVT